MELNELINKRRSYRALKQTDIDEKEIYELAEAAKMAPSCFNYQPWRFVFVHNKAKLVELFDALSNGNEWAEKSSMMVAIFSDKKNDCIVGDRKYYLFDTGMAVGFMLLKATELDLVTHLMAGFNSKKAKQILKIPEEKNLIALMAVGKHADDYSNLTEEQIESEANRPKRKKINEFVYLNEYEE